MPIARKTEKVLSLKPKYLQPAEKVSTTKLELPIGRLLWDDKAVDRLVSGGGV